MALIWLVYEHGGARTVMIVDAPDLLQGRMKAALAGIDGDFVEGYPTAIISEGAEGEAR